MGDIQNNVFDPISTGSRIRKILAKKFSMFTFLIMLKVWRGVKIHRQKPLQNNPTLNFNNNFWYSYENDFKPGTYTPLYVKRHLQYLSWRHQNNWRAKKESSNCTPRVVWDSPCYHWNVFFSCNRKRWRCDLFPYFTKNRQMNEGRVDFKLLSYKIFPVKKITYIFYLKS